MKLFGMFGEQSVARRLTLAVTVSVGAIAFIALIFLVSQYLGYRSVESAGQLVQFGSRISAVQAGMLRARTQEKDFLALKDVAELEKHKKTMASVYVDIEAAQNAGFSPALDAQLDKVRKAAKKYEQVFLTASLSMIEIGLTERDGLHDVMRKAGLAAEQELYKVQNLPLLTSMLHMRNNEKDFIQYANTLFQADKYVAIQSEEYEGFEGLASGLKGEAGRNVMAKADVYHTAFQNYAAAVRKLLEEIAEFREAAQQTEPALKSLQQETEAAILAQQSEQKKNALVVGVILLSLLALSASVVSYSLTATGRGVTGPLTLLQDTVAKIAAGDTRARAGLRSRDEFGALAVQFDKMMDEREAVNAKIRKENAQLNQSVLTLLQGVSRLSQKDLTVKVPVAEDVTGAVSDALNLLSSEIATILHQVTDVAREVADVSDQVKVQSDSVLGLSRNERHEVREAAKELVAASHTMHEIAKLAKDCNDAAQNAIGTTRTALDSVGATVGSIGTIRDTVRETEKRIKRLGERSQEISGVVNLINAISERTHILALNAAMHAASAGEAGRGFAVVAGEVQRLAENAREATSQIATLVHNIQVETADTVSKMNEVISHVVDGSKLAEQAGEQMRDTEERTNRLVELVGQIAQGSEMQAQMSDALRTRTERVEKGTEITGAELEQQAKNTEALVLFANQLVDAVGVFKLPELEGGDSSVVPMKSRRVA